MIAIAAIAIASQPPLIPLPQKLEWRSEAFQVRQETAVESKGAAPWVLSRLREALGKPLPAKRGGAILLAKEPGYAPEGYALSVDGKRVEIRASSDAGLFYGVQTLRQLHNAGSIAGCRIEDAPRFGWRGLLLDDSRHFFGVEGIHKFIDNMSAHKLNTFHWHLTDDGGWRVQVDRYPELTDIGAWRREQGVEWSYTNLWFPGRQAKEPLYGGFYTKKQLRDIVRYASERGVTIVPEIEMPGHAAAAVASRPELACQPPAGQMEAYLKAINSQAPTMMCPGNDRTIEFCKRVLDETLEVFPSKFIHIGADEVDKTLWRGCAKCQARMKEHGLKDEHELQSWFVRQMDAYLASKGRRLIGWDEILEGGLAPGATVMSWRGISGGIQAARSGHEVVMSPTSHCYLDYSYDTIPTSLVYDYEPIPKELTGSQRDRVLGVQGNVWTEWLSSMEEVDRMTYPRALALAEVGWSQPERRDAKDFNRRLSEYMPRLDDLGIGPMIIAPILVPDVLNRAVAKEWTVSQPPQGLRLQLSDGTNVLGDRIAARDTLEVAYVTPGGRKGLPATGRAVHLRTGKAPEATGLNRKFIPWKGNLTPPAQAFEAIAATPVAKADLQGVPVDQPFALLFEGWIRVEKAGRYAFILGADDGAVLEIDGQPIVLNDGPHGYVERQATVDLEAGDYPVRVRYFDAGGAQRLGLFWIPPGGARSEMAAFRRSG